MSASAVEVITKSLVPRSELRDSHRRGEARTSLAFFEKNSSEKHAPHVMPLGWIHLPEPLTALRQETEASSAAGIFADIGRAWFTMDNRIYLWSLFDRSFIFVDSPFGVIAGAYLIKPLPGMSDANALFTLVIVTEAAISMHGLVFNGVDPTTADLLEPTESVLTIGTDALTSKVVQHLKSLRMFATSNNGHLYELLWEPNQRALSWRDASVLFSGTPMLQTVGELVANIKRSWGFGPESLLDAAIDHERSLLYTLSYEGHIDTWSIKQNDLSRISRTKHTLENLKHLKPSVPSKLPQFKMLWVVTSPRRSAGNVVALTTEGERYIYSTQVQRWDITGGQSLTASERLGQHSKAIFSCGVDDLFVYGNAAHGCIGSVPPNGYPTLDAYSEAVGLYSDLGGKNFIDVAYLGSNNESDTQSPSAPIREIAILTNEGVLIALRLRPVDILVALLENRGDVKIAESMSQAELISLLILIASGGAVGAPLFAKNLAFIDPICQKVLKQICSTVSADCLRKIMSYLAEVCNPIVTEATDTTGATSLTVSFSPFTHGLTLAVARSLASVWNSPILESRKHTLNLSESLRLRASTSVRGVIRFIDLCRGELWLPVDGKEPMENVVFSATSASIKVGVSCSPQFVAEIQSFRVASLRRIANIAHQVLRFCEFLGDISPSIVVRAARATRDKSDYVFKDVVENPARIADFSRKILNIVVDVERSSGIPNYDRLLELFDEMEKDCPDIFTASDAVVGHATLELDQLKRLSSQGLMFDGVETTLARLKENAAAIYASGPDQLDRVCGYLLEMDEICSAIEVILAAASQQKHEDALHAYLNGSDSVSLAAKTALVARVASIMERLWRNKDTSMFNRLIQDPGLVWLFYPDDTVSHYLLLDWLTASRTDQRITREMRRIVARCPSKCLESYLKMNGARLSLEAAEFYRFQKKDLVAACRAYLAVASSSIPSHIPPGPDRVAYRSQRTFDALVCAKEANWSPTEISRIAMQHETLENQRRLATVIKRFLDSGSPTLSQIVDVDGVEMTQRQAGESHLESVCDRVLDPEKIFEIASFYRSLGGVDIQLRLLSAHHVADQDLYTGVIASAFDCAADPKRCAQELLAYYEAPGFPVHIILAHLLARGVNNVHELIFDVCGVPYEQGLAAVKTLTDVKSGSRLLQGIPEAFYNISLVTLINVYVEFLRFAFDHRGATSSSAVLVMHANNVKKVAQTAGVTLDSSILRMESNLETRHIRCAA